MENLFETLVGKLRKGIVSFVYRKKDGTERHACGTLYGIGHTIKGTHPISNAVTPLPTMMWIAKVGGRLSSITLWRLANFDKRPWTSITTSALHWWLSSKRR